MSDPMTPNRYQHDHLRERLASEYVLGTLTPRTQRRLEQLMTRDPSWWQWIDLWQQRLAPVQPDQAPPLPERVWSRLAGALFARRVSPWWPMAMAASLLLGLWLRPLLPGTEPLITPVRYLAVMSTAEQPEPFALLAYQGKRPGQSKIQLQQGLTAPALPDDAELWMRDRASGRLTRLAPLIEMRQARPMTPKEWQRLKGSSELLVMSGQRLLYRGHCIELLDPK